MQLRSDGFPRRSDVTLLTPIEQLLRQTILAVERMPASPLLTDASVLIQQAREKVADFVESLDATPTSNEIRRQFFFDNGDSSWHVGSEDDMGQAALAIMHHVRPELDELLIDEMTDLEFSVEVRWMKQSDVDALSEG